jgi:hypothetical protein
MQPRQTSNAVPISSAKKIDSISKIWGFISGKMKRIFDKAEAKKKSLHIRRSKPKR